jgi:hypothetical protein
MPGGVVIPVPEATKEAVKRTLPKLPFEYVESAAINYQLLSGHSAEPPAKVRANLQSIAEQAAALYASLGTLSEESREALWDALEPVGGVAFWEQASFVTQMLMGLARNAALEIEASPGRPMSPKHGLVRSFANILTAHGYTADARPNGDLCFLTREMLSVYGDAPDDVRSLVRDALGKKVK